ncbi:MAG: pyridoxal-phosphate dependent enzyme [Chloroflexi bacterium]|nr:pyridoxal-phosphate dependent enzyme [Chloroflexota bacterium]
MTIQNILSYPAIGDTGVRNGAAPQLINTEPRSALDGLCRPNIIQLQSNLVAAQFDLMKIVPARFILENALKTGLLKEGGLVVESSSGTFALGLAIVCANLGLRLSLVTGQLEEALEWRLRHLGASIEKVYSGSGYMGGIQQKRLDRLSQVMADTPGSFWPRQYDNPLHPVAYAALAESLAKSLGEIDFLVASVGSGGSITGFARILRKSNPDLKVIAVDHNLSVLFGPTSGEATPLCRECYEPLLGMGSDIVIPNVDHTQVDEVHWVPVAQMINAIHHIHRHYGLLLGPTAGAAYSIADWIARSHPASKVLTIFPDHGIRYVKTVYNGEWLNQRAEELQRTWDQPKRVESPTAVGSDWAIYPWGRRSYPEVLGHGPVSRQ